MKTPENMTQGVKGLVTTGMLALLVGCGGGGSSSGGSTADATEILTQGTIQRFGSVYVNDVRYVRSSNGQVLDDDNPSASEDSLRIGMRVKLRGRINDDGTGTYDTIEVDNELKGPIVTASIVIPDLNNPRVGTLEVMGTTVISSETTFFDESGSGSTVNSLLDLDDASGLEDVIEVSGLFNENGDLEALRIEKKADDLATYLAGGRKLEVKGTVDSAGSGLLTYTSGLVVDYSSAEIDDDLPADPANWSGLYVESKCDPEAPTFNAATGCFNGTTLVATKVDNDLPEVDEGYRAEFEGIISGFNGLDDFKVGYIPVDAADATLFCGNVTLGNGVKVKVRGDIVDVNGVRTVDASSVECRQAKTVRLEGTLTADSDGVTLSLNGVTVITNDKTEKDDLASIGDLQEFDAVAVRGFVDGSGDVIAVRVEGEDQIDSDDFIVQAPQDQVGSVNKSGNSFTLLGVTISTALLQNGDYEGLNDLTIGRDAFYDALLNGTAPAFKAKGSYDATTGTLTAREVELEDND